MQVKLILFLTIYWINEEIVEIITKLLQHILLKLGEFHFPSSQGPWVKNKDSLRGK